MTSYIFYTILIIFISAASVLAYIVNNKYKRLSKKEKQSLEKSLKKMGFFILLVLLLPTTSGQVHEDRGLYPVVIPTDALLPAEEKFEELTYDTQILLEETTWRLGITNFLNTSNTSSINSTNSTNNPGNYVIL